MTAPDPALAAMVRGRSDEEILALSNMFGGPRALTGMFLGGLAAQLDRSTFAQRVVLGYEISNGGESYTHTVRVGDGSVVVDDADVSAATATVVVSFADLVRVVAGELDLDGAVGDGRIEIRGDQAAAGRVLSVLADA